MAGHVIHAAVVARIQPFLQIRLVFPQLDVGDADLLEAQSLGPLLNLVFE